MDVLPRFLAMRERQLLVEACVSQLDLKCICRFRICVIMWHVVCMQGSNTAMTQDKASVAYARLAKMAALNHERLWVLRPKLHASRHIYLSTGPS